MTSEKKVSLIRRESLPSSSHASPVSVSSPNPPMSHTQRFTHSLSRRQSQRRRTSFAQQNATQDDGLNEARPVLVFSDGTRALQDPTDSPLSVQPTTLEASGLFHRSISHTQANLNKGFGHARTTGPTLDATAMIFGRTGPRAYDPISSKNPYDPANWQIPWDQREMFKQRKNDFDTKDQGDTGIFSSYSPEVMCNFCVQPKFWRKIDWAFRFGAFVILPTVALALNPNLVSRRVFLSGSVIIDAAYTSFQENIGLGIQGVLNDAQGYLLSFMMAMITIALSPDDGWQFILLQAIQIVTINILFPDLMSTASASLASLTAQLLRNDVVTELSFNYIANFYACYATGMAMALPAYFIPRPIIALRRAELYCGIAGNAISVSAKGIMSSFWCPPLQRQLNLVSLRALQQTSTAAIQITDTAMKDAVNEPHKGLTLLRMQQRIELLKGISVILHGGLTIIEQIAAMVAERSEAAQKFDEPGGPDSNEEDALTDSDDDDVMREQIHSPHDLSSGDEANGRQQLHNPNSQKPPFQSPISSNATSQEKKGFTDEAKLMGKALEKHLVKLAVATDIFILKIVDFTHTLKGRDYETFEDSVKKFENAVDKVRRKYVAENVEFSPDSFNIQIGFFLFVLQELCYRIKSFREPTKAPSNIKAWAWGPVNTMKKTWNNFVYLFTSLLRGQVPRRAKEGIKLSISMTISLTYEIYSGSPSPVSGSAIIPSIYRKTGADTFYFSTLRVLGIVFGSTTSYALVRVLIEPTTTATDGYYWILGILPIMCFLGGFVIRSPSFNSAGKAWVSSCISILSRYSNRTAAIQRITNNVFAILTYFIISMVVWPVRATGRISLELDYALRSLRDSSGALLKGFNAKDFESVVAEVTKSTAKFNKHAVNVGALIVGASREPHVTGGNTFPVEQWKQIAITLRDIAAILALTRFAYLKFRSSSGEGKNVSSPQTTKSTSGSEAPTAYSTNDDIIKHLSKAIGTVGELVYAALDLQLLLAGGITDVPVNHLVRIRIHLMNTVEVVEEKFCEVLGRNVKRMQQQSERQKQLRKMSSAAASTERQQRSKNAHLESFCAFSPILSSSPVSPQLSEPTQRPPQPSSPPQPSNRSQKTPKEHRPHIAIQPPTPSAVSQAAGVTHHTAIPIGSPDSWLSSEESDKEEVETHSDDDFVEAPVVREEGGQVGVGDAILGNRGSFATAANIRDAIRSQLRPDGKNGSQRRRAAPAGLEPLDAFLCQPLSLDTSSIHSLEAFLFGIRGLVNSIWALEKQILELNHITKIYEKV